MMRSERVSATDQVVNWVKSEIQSGRLRVGDKLPKEADMAEMLGVGRSSLREGMKVQTQYGVGAEPFAEQEAAERKGDL